MTETVKTAKAAAFSDIIFDNLYRTLLPALPENWTPDLEVEEERDIMLCCFS